MSSIGNKDILAKNLKYYISRSGKDRRELAEIWGFPYSTVTEWINAKKYPRIDRIEIMAAYFGIPKSDLIEEKSSSKVSSHTPKPIRIPVLGSIPAGIPIEAIEDILDWEELPASMGKGNAEYFALRIKGDSMSPSYLDGDVLIFRKQETCNSGQDCAIMVNGDDATFKRVKISEKGITLLPLNPAYDPLYFTHEECAEVPVRILGVVAELRRKF